MERKQKPYLGCGEEHNDPTHDVITVYASAPTKTISSYECSLAFARASRHQTFNAELLFETRHRRIVASSILPFLIIASCLPMVYAGGSRASAGMVAAAAMLVSMLLGLARGGEAMTKQQPRTRTRHPGQKMGRNLGPLEFLSPGGGRRLFFF